MKMVKQLYPKVCRECGRRMTVAGRSKRVCFPCGGSLRKATPQEWDAGKQTWKAPTPAGAAGRDEGRRGVSKPGELHDRKGYPIYPGDLLRTPHYRDRRWGQQWLYHTAIWNETKKTMEMVPTSELESSLIGRGGRCWLTASMAGDAEIISGHGPKDCLDYHDRPRVKTTTAGAAGRDEGGG